jgi:hypothetical protein
VRHQTEDVAAFVADAGDVFHRAVGIGRRRRLAFGVDVAQQNLPVFVQPLESYGVGVIAALAVLDRHFEQLAALETRRERRVALLDPQMHRTADELQIGVAHQRAGQQAGLAKNLKAVANPQHEPAAPGKPHHAAQDRREARHRAAAQVIAVGKAARQNNAIEVAGQLVLVPEQLDLLAELGLERVKNVVIVARPGKSDDTPTHSQ